MIYKDGLQTERLITRFFTKDDGPVWNAYCHDPEATRFTAIPGKTCDELTQAWLARTLNRYATGQYGGQLLISKETGEVIGQAGLLLQEINDRTEVEVGYHLIRKYWGKGYATEAAKLFLDYGFEYNAAPTIVSVIHPQNDMSKAVALRMGMKLVDNKARFRGEDYYLYRITREEWETLQK